MRTFKGNINGREFDNQDDFILAYQQLIENWNGTDKISVSYEQQESEQLQEEPTVPCGGKNTCLCGDQNECEQSEKGNKSDIGEVTEELSELISEAAEMIQQEIEREKMDYHHSREFDTVMSTSFYKIRRTVNSLPEHIRKELFETIHSATEVMVDNVNSELTDRMYEESKYQIDVCEHRSDLEKEIREIENEISKLNEHRNVLCRKMEELDDEYRSSEYRMGVAMRSVDFFDRLLEVLSGKEPVSKTDIQTPKGNISCGCGIC